MNRQLLLANFPHMKKYLNINPNNLDFEEWLKYYRFKYKCNAALHHTYGNIITNEKIYIKIN